MGMRFKPNHAGIAAIGRSTELATLLQGLVDAVALAAKGLASAQFEGGQGDLVESIEGQVTVNDRGKMIGRVNVWDFKGAWKELGTSREAPQPYLWPATEQVLAGTRLSTATRGQTA